MDSSRLLLATKILLYYTLFLHPTPSLSSPPLILPLQSNPIPSHSLPRPPNKLSFIHNVSLTVSLSVGSPPQQATMVLDTGSELSWLHCTQSHPLSFTPHLSTSYRPIPCSSPTCTTRTRDLTIPASCDPTNKLCHAVLSYADASSVEGNLATDDFRMNGSGSFPGLVFGCMDSGSSSNPDEDAKTTGLIGMNRGSLSLISQMGFQTFAYCIASRDSTGVLLLGRYVGFNHSYTLNLSYTPLIQISSPLPYFDRSAYTVGLEGIRVGSTVLQLPKSIFEPDHTGAGQTMVDSGTQFTFLLGPVYAALKNEFMKQTNGVLRLLNDTNFVFQGAMDLCYRVEASRIVLPPLPSVSLIFRGGAEMSVSGRKLVYRVPGVIQGGDEIDCLTFGNSDLLGVEAYVIGHHHQQDVWMEFDLMKSRVGLMELRCDLARQRLGLGA